MFRKAVAVILISVVVAQIGAMWAVLTSAIWVHKQTKELRMTNPDLWVCFNLSNSELEELGREKDELVINGKLYDIVSIHSTGATFEVIAVADEREDTMKRNLSGLHSKKTDFTDLARLACTFSLTLYHPEDMLGVSLHRFAPEKPLCEISAEGTRKGIYWNPGQPPTI